MVTGYSQSRSFWPARRARDIIKVDGREAPIRAATVGRRPGEASALNRNLRSTGRVVLIYTGPRPGEQNRNPGSGRRELRALRSRRTPKRIMQFRLLALVFEGGVRLRVDLRRNRVR
jgi:hypothetical protein